MYTHTCFLSGARLGKGKSRNRGEEQGPEQAFRGGFHQASTGLGGILTQPALGGNTCGLRERESDMRD